MIVSVADLMNSSFYVKWFFQQNIFDGLNTDAAQIN